MPLLPTPAAGPGAATAWVSEHLAHLLTGPVRASSIRGGRRPPTRRSQPGPHRRLSSLRLVFLVQTLAELDVEVRLGDPVTELAGRTLAVTCAPVPGFARRAARLDVAALHPWPWLRRPTSGSVRSWSSWVRATSA